MPFPTRLLRALLPRPCALAALIAVVAIPVRGLAAEPALPKLPDVSRIELHGTLDGKPFWARVLPPDPQFGNHRVMQLVYTPPAPDALGGAHLVDCPFILLDEHARVLAWNGRDGLSSVVPAAPSGYDVSRELVEGEAENAKVAAENRTIPGALAWDLHLAPLLVALTWTATAPAAVRAVDLFGPPATGAQACSWNGAKVEIAGKLFSVVADQSGAFQRLVDDTGATRIEVAETPAAAKP